MNFFTNPFKGRQPGSTKAVAPPQPTPLQPSPTTGPLAPTGSPGFQPVQGGQLNQNGVGQDAFREMVGFFNRTLR